MNAQQTKALQSLRDRIRCVRRHGSDALLKPLTWTSVCYNALYLAHHLSLLARLSSNAHSAVCVHDHAQWETSWKTALSDPSATGRGLVPPELFFDALEANSVVLGRTAEKLLLLRFQEPSGAVQAAKFLRWMALGAPADHANPELLFARLPQPYRRVRKVLERAILDAAWALISTQSARFKAENFAAPTTGRTPAAQTSRSPRAGERPHNDYEAAKKRSCRPTTQLTLIAAPQRVVGIAASSLSSVTVVALDHEAQEAGDIVLDTPSPSLRVLSTSEPLQDLREIPITFPTPSDDPAPGSGVRTVTRRSHVRIRGLSALQRVQTTGSSAIDLATSAPLLEARSTSSERFLLALHLQQTTVTTTTAEAGHDAQSDAAPEPTPPVLVTRDCVAVYVIETQSAELHASEEGDATATHDPPLQASSRLVAVAQPPKDAPDACVTAVALSPDAALLAVTWASSVAIDFYPLPHKEPNPDDARDDEQNKPSEDHAEATDELVVLSPAFQVDLSVVTASCVKAVGAPMLHFLVAPATAARTDVPAGQSPPAHAVAVCHGVSVSKYLLPVRRDDSKAPLTLAPTKTWSHLTRISSSALDATTQFLALGFEDGTLAVWDVLQDVDVAFLSAQLADDSTSTSTVRGEPRAPISAAISSVTLCLGYLVALAGAQQRLFFIDVRVRGRPLMLRMVTPPSLPLVTPAHQASSRSAASGVFMTRLAPSSTTVDVPVALVEHSNGMTMIYDVRSAEAVASFHTRGHASPTASASATPSSSTASLLTVSGSSSVLEQRQTEPRDSITTIAGSLEALCVVADTETVSAYAWPDLLLTCMPSLSSVLQQRQEEPSAATVKQLFVANGAVPPPPAHAAATFPFDSLENLLLRMAGVAPTSSSVQQPKSKQSTGPGASPSGPALSAAGRNSMTSLASLSDPLVKAQTQRTEPVVSRALLQPVVPDSHAFFEQYCREDLDATAMADKEARLHRKRRDLLKALAAGGAW